MPRRSDTAVTTKGAAAATSATSARAGHYRWIICALLSLATTINYVDRQVLGILAPPLQAQFGWSESDYGWITTAFTGVTGAKPSSRRAPTIELVRRSSKGRAETHSMPNHPTCRDVTVLR
jgi:hypothetical protein